MYRSAAEYDYLPFVSVEDGVPTGFSVELLRAVAEVMRLDIQFKVDYWDVMLAELKAGELDVLPLIARTPDREPFIDFSFPYIVLRGNIFVRQDNDSIRDFDDLRGKEIIVQNGDSIHEYVLHLGLTDSLVPVRTFKEAFELLSSGRHDAVLAPNLIGARTLELNRIKNVKPVSKLADDGVSLIRVELKDFEQKFCFGVRKGDTELLSRLNEGLAFLYGDGTFNSLYRKWFPFLIDNRPSAKLVLTYLAAILVPLIIVLTAAYNVVLRRRVKAKALEITRSYRLVESIIENTPSPIYIFDTKGRLVTCNARLENLLHSRKGDIIGKPRESFMPENIARHHRENDREVLKGGEPMVFEERNSEDGNIRYYQSVKFPLFDDNNKPYAVCGISTDITERIEINRRLVEQNKEMEKARSDAEHAASIKSRFLSNMSHEIRNPLNGIIGLTDLLSRTDLDSSQREYVELMRSSNALLLGIVNDILDLARIEAGKREISREAMDIRKAVSEMIDSFRMFTDEKNLDLSVSIDPDVPATICTDPRSFRQILMNLLNNAVKFTDRGGIRVGLTRIGADRVELTVADTGIGIPEDKLTTIFENFTQLDASYTKRFQGTGLGLPIVKELAELLDIRLTVESVMNEGTAFHLVIPVGRAEEAPGMEPPRKAAAPGPRAPRRVLVAEDNAINLLMMRKTLEDRGHTVATARDGVEALEKAAAERYNIIFMDIQMPNMNGIDCSRELRKRGVTCPIVAVTGYSMKENIDEFLAAGMTDYLVKPVDRNALLGKL